MIDAARLQPQRTVKDERSRLRFAINKIRSNKGWANMPIVFIPEDGPAGAGENLFEFVRDMTPILCMTEAGNAAYGANRYGVRKDQTITIRMKEKLLLSMVHDPRTNGVHMGISTELFSLQHCDKGMDVAENLKKLRSQMYNYRVLVKKAYSENANDDLLIAVMMLVSWSDFFIQQRNSGRTAYAEFHRQHLSGGSKLNR